MYLKYFISFVILCWYQCSVEAGDFNLNPAIPDESTCGSSNEGNIIISQQVERGEFPWSARLQYGKPDSFHCEGTLINSRYVLTSGLCLNPPVGNISKIRLGQYKCEVSSKDCKEEFIDVGPEELIPHKGFNKINGHTVNDIGLIRLDKEITFSDDIRPICLPKPQDVYLKAGDKLVETGWSTRGSSNPKETKKVKTDVFVTSLEDCNKIYNKRNIIVNENNICAQVKGNEPCSALSGGSLMQRRSTQKWYLEGIASFGPVICQADSFPNIYTNVQNYLEWIHSNIRK